VLTAGARYSAVLRVPGVRALFTASVIARLPMGVDVLALLLFLHDRTGSFASGGIVVGALALGRALGAVVQGRLIDRHGIRRVLLPAAYAHGVLLGGVVALGFAGAETALLAACALVAGLTDPPISSVVRSLWFSLLSDRRSLVSVAFGMDTVIVELIFVAGPLLTALAVAADGAQWALALSSLLVAVGTTALVAAAPSAPQEPTGNQSGGLVGALRAPGMRTVALTMLPLGVCFGAMEVTLPAFGHATGDAAWGGVLIALFSIGSTAGGLVYGARTIASVRRTFLGLLCVLPVGVLPLALVPGEPVLIGVLVVVAGACIAPLLAALGQLVGQLAADGTVTEAYTWNFTAMITGTSIGYAVVGGIVESSGWRAGFAAALAAAVFGTVIGLCRRRSLRVSTARAGVCRDVRGPEPAESGRRHFADAPASTPLGMTPSEALLALFAAWEAADPDTLGELFTEDGVYEDPLKPARLQGRDQVRSGNARGMRAIRDCRITVETMLESDTRAMCEGTFASEIIATGGRRDFRFTALAELRDGKIFRLAEYFDTRPLVS